jgi:hypothetical protein
MSWAYRFDERALKDLRKLGKQAQSGKSSPILMSGSRAKAIPDALARDSRQTWRVFGAIGLAIIASSAKSGAGSFWCWW